MNSDVGLAGRRRINIAFRECCVSGSTVQLSHLDGGWTIAVPATGPATSCDWQAVRVSSSHRAGSTAGAGPGPGSAAAVELRALLRQLYRDSKLTYDQLAERAHVSRSTVGNYLATPSARPRATL